MFNLPAALIGCTVFAGVGWLLTQPVELRSRRGLRIVCSLPFVSLFANTLARRVQDIGSAIDGMLFLWGPMAMFVVALIWRNVLGYYAGRAAGRLIFGDLNSRTGVRADFRAAKSFLSHGEFSEALEETTAELKRDALNYEGLLLLADVHQHLGAPARALGALQKLSTNRELTPSQRALVQARQSQLEAHILVAEANRRR